jgi:hypothetical protein
LATTGGDNASRGGPASASSVLRGQSSFDVMAGATGFDQDIVC